MLQILVAAIFLSSSTFASVILEKHSTSGYVVPEWSFVKDCKVYSKGHVESTTTNNEGTVIGYSRKVSLFNIQTIKVLNHLAQSGEIEESQMPCDTGTTILKGRIGSNEIEIESLIDCGSKRVNQSPAADFLKTIARDLCGF
jgi:hypothetical protein